MTTPEMQREAGFPQDGERPGQRSIEMTDVVDIRPDRFLRELSEGIGISEAGKKAGIEHDELVKMLEDNPKFRHTVREVVLDRAEDVLRQDIGALLDGIQQTADEAITLIRGQMEEAVAVIRESSTSDG